MDGAVLQCSDAVAPAPAIRGGVLMCVAGRNHIGIVCCATPDTQPAAAACAEGRVWACKVPTVPGDLCSRWANGTARGGINVLC